MNHWQKVPHTNPARWRSSCGSFEIELTGGTYVPYRLTENAREPLKRDTTGRALGYPVLSAAKFFTTHATA